VIASVLSPLGILVLEREQLKFSDLWGTNGILYSWAQDAGGFAAVGLFIYVIVLLTAPAAVGEDTNRRSRLLPVILLLAAIAGLLYLTAAGLYVTARINAPPEPPTPPPANPYERKPPKPPTQLDIWTGHAMAVAGVVSLIGFGLPFSRDVLRLRYRRIWALAKLSLKEAVRRKVLWVFLTFLLIFLFPPKWFFPIKLEDEVRTNVSVIYWAMTPLLLLTVGLLSSFSIPNDIKTQTIHTIVTKPVERFEIVLGRVLGYSILSFAVLATLSVLSLVLIWTSNPSADAASESLKARVPVYGRLSFYNVRSKKADVKGQSVGREWEYRSYIAGGANTAERAVWSYFDDALPAELKNKPFVPCEFAFDIFRTTKGEENKGVYVTLTFVAHKWGDPAQPDPALKQQYDDAVRDINLNAQPDDPNAAEAWKKIDAAAEKFGFYEYRSKEIADYHTFDIKVPGGIFRAALEGQPPEINIPGLPPAKMPRLAVLVKCESRTQFLGVAKNDLYLLASDGSFAWNFLKGSIGLWLRLVLVIAIAVACSTYLSGVISFLVTIFLFIAGQSQVQEFVQELAEGRSPGGGPAESLVRLAENKNLTIPLDQTATAVVADYFDVMYRWVFRRLLNVLPDVDLFNWSNYVAEGFNIDGTDMIMSSLILLGYLLPWGIIGYYLMKSREIAN